MRLKCFLTICLVWIGTLTFVSDLYATDLLLGNGAISEQSSADQPEDVGDAGSKDDVSVWDQAAAWVWAKQREFHRALTRELRELRGKDSVGWALVLMGFLYGFFHAAGPGHGKAVLTTYLLTHRNEMNRGIAMGTAAALMQGVTALLLVYGLIGLAGWIPQETQTATLWVTRISFMLLAGIGLFLFSRSALSFFRSLHQWRHQTREHQHGNNHHQHDLHHHGHVHGEGCGCKHVPTVSEIKTAGNWREVVGVVMAIGLRPCSGAVLVLILASVMDLTWHGVFAVLAMSIGTAITVVVLAIFAVKAREWASTLVNHTSAIWTLAADGVGAMGGTLLLFFGLWLLYTSFALNPAMGL